MLKCIMYSPLNALYRFDFLVKLIIVQTLRTNELKVWTVLSTDDIVIYTTLLGIVWKRYPLDPVCTEHSGSRRFIFMLDRYRL